MRLPLVALTVLLAAAVLTLPQCGTDYGPFSGSAAYSHTEAILAHGPRPPGSESIRKVADTIEQRLQAIDPSLKLQRQTFKKPTLPGKFPDGRDAKDIEFQNLWVEIPGTDPNGPILAFGAHYDSKLTWPEQPFEVIAALDSAAPCGVLIELARHFIQQPKPFSHNIWIIFFDGEESIPWEWNRNGPDNLIGSTHFATTMDADKERFPQGLSRRMKTFVLLDLLGNETLKFDRDTASTKGLNEIFLAAANELGIAERMHKYRSSMTDDHLPFKQKGVKVIDLIDFRYRTAGEHQGQVPDHAQQFEPYWHTANDNLDRVDPEALSIVGNLILRALPKIEAKYYR